MNAERLPNNNFTFAYFNTFIKITKSNSECDTSTTVEQNKKPSLVL